MRDAEKAILNSAYREPAEPTPLEKTWHEMDEEILDMRAEVKRLNGRDKFMGIVSCAAILLNVLTGGLFYWWGEVDGRKQGHEVVHEVQVPESPGLCHDQVIEIAEGNRTHTCPHPEQEGSVLGNNGAGLWKCACKR